MTILTVVRDVCAVVGVLQPTSLFAGIASNRTQQELLALANEMAQRIAYNFREWTTLKAMATFTGDGVATAFNLPANYKRMLLQSNVWRSTQTQSPMRFVPNLDRWGQRTAQGAYDSRGEWTIYGGQIHIRPALVGPIMGPAPLPSLWLNSHDYIVGETAYDDVTANSWVTAIAHTSAPTATFADDRTANPTYWTAMAVAPPIVTTPAQTATFNYLDKNCVNVGSGYGDRFTADTDSFRLDERLLKLGMIWQWKAQKGTSYAEDLGTYGDAINAEAGADQPSPIILGNNPISTSAGIAYPWQLPTNGP